MEIIRVSGETKANELAGAITGFFNINNVKKIEMQAIGAGAVNQAIKAIAIARGFMAPLGINLICIPAFTSVEIDNEIRTAMKIIVKEID